MHNFPVILSSLLLLNLSAMQKRAWNILNILVDSREVDYAAGRNSLLNLFISSNVKFKLIWPDKSI